MGWKTLAHHFITVRSLQSKHIGHRIQPRLLANQPSRSMQRATRKRGSIVRAMRQFDSLAWPRKRHRVIAHNIAAAEHGKSDRAASACARFSVAREHSGFF